MLYVLGYIGSIETRREQMTIDILSISNERIAAAIKTGTDAQALAIVAAHGQRQSDRAHCVAADSAGNEADYALCREAHDASMAKLAELIEAVIGPLETEDADMDALFGTKTN